jgi:uroporphyrinogen decarboxylase
MNRRELVKAALRHQETPRVPYCIKFTPEGEKNVKKLGAASADEYFDNDIVTVFPPWWQWYELGDDWKQPAVPTSPPRVCGRGSYTEFFAMLKLLRENSDKYILVMVYGSHFEKANFARGIENFLADMAGAPEFAQALLTRIIEKNLVMLENFLAASEIDGVLLGSDWGTQRDLIMSPRTWQKMIRDGEQREYDLVHSYGKDVWIHSCGNVERIIPSLIEMGVDVLNPVQPEAMDLASLKARFGDRLTFWGGISTQQTLPNGTPAEVIAEARRVRDLMSQGGGYIFSPSQEIQGDVPPENIAALRQVAQEGR